MPRETLPNSTDMGFLDFRSGRKLTCCGNSNRRVAIPHVELRHVVLWWNPNHQISRRRCESPTSDAEILNHEKATLASVRMQCPNVPALFEKATVITW